MSIIRSIIRYISYILTALVAVLYLLASFAPEIPPLRLMFPAFLGLGFPFVFGLMTVVTLYWLLRFRWQVLLILLGVYALSWRSISAYFPVNRSANIHSVNKARTEGQNQVLKILSYNVAVFGYSDHKPSKPNRILLYIKSSEADIVCLQEASPWTVNQEQIRSYLGKEYPYIKLIRSQSNGSYLMMLSRFPIIEGKRIEINSHANGAAAFTLDILGRKTEVINVHLESFRLNNAMGKEYVEMASRGDFFTLEDAFKSKLAPTFAAHNLQANIIHEYIRSLGHDRVIVCGDFNDTPVSYTLGKIGEGLQNAYCEAGNGLGISFRSRFFKVRIDHILLGKAFRPLYTEVDKSARGSDHYPIYSYIIDAQ